MPGADRGTGKQGSIPFLLVGGRCAFWCSGNDLGTSGWTLDAGRLVGDYMDVGPLSLEAGFFEALADVVNASEGDFRTQVSPSRLGNGMWTVNVAIAIATARGRTFHRCHQQSWPTSLHSYVRQQSASGKPCRLAACLAKTIRLPRLLRRYHPCNKFGWPFQSPRYLSGEAVNLRCICRVW